MIRINYLLIGITITTATLAEKRGHSTFSSASLVSLGDAGKTPGLSVLPFDLAMISSRKDGRDGCFPATLSTPPPFVVR